MFILRESIARRGSVVQEDVHRGKVSGIRPQLMVPLTSHRLTDKLHSSNQLVYIVAINPDLPTKSIIIDKSAISIKSSNHWALEAKSPGIALITPTRLRNKCKACELGTESCEGFSELPSSSSRTVLGAIFDIVKVFWSVLLTMIAESSINSYLTSCTGIVSVRDFGRNRSLQFPWGMSTHAIDDDYTTWQSRSLMLWCSS